MFEWYTHLCEYYNVTPQQALELGSRSDGRKPNLPGSKTCQSVSEKTYEDLWEMSDRKTTEQVFQFYRDMGAWNSFRQCVRHKDHEKLHMSVIGFLLKNGALFDDAHICEYGCGIAPFITTFLKYLMPSETLNLNITLCEVDSEHFDFAKFRLNKIKESKNLNVNLNFETILPNKLPDFSNIKLNSLICFEVLEHIPSPVALINNIKNSMVPGGYYIENFIKHNDEEFEDGPDLLSAHNERDEYYEIVNEYFNLVVPTQMEAEADPNCLKVWQRNSL